MENEDKNSFSVRFEFGASQRAPRVFGSGLGSDVAFHSRSKATLLAVLRPRVTLLELKKVFDPLEFSGSSAVFNSYKRPPRKGGEKILRRDIK